MHKKKTNKPKLNFDLISVLNFFLLTFFQLFLLFICMHTTSYILYIFKCQLSQFNTINLSHNYKPNNGLKKNNGNGNFQNGEEVETLEHPFVFK